MTTQEKIAAAKKDFSTILGTELNGLQELDVKIAIFYRYARFELRLPEEEALKYIRLAIDQGEQYFATARFYLWYCLDQLENLPDKN